MAVAGRLTTHVLDIMHGKPAAGMRIDLSIIEDEHSHHLVSTFTNSDGRLDRPLLDGERFHPGIFLLDFHVRHYFALMDVASPFLDIVPLRFVIGDETHYHVPLLVSPFAYSTYRGS